MKNFLKSLLAVFGNSMGMAALESDGYAGSQDAPIQKLNPGQLMGKLVVITDKITLTAAITNGDTIEGLMIPEGARVIDAFAHIPVSLGATGIFTVGTRAHNQRVEGAADVAVAQDADSLVGTVDGGGQAALTRAAAGQALLNKKIGAENARIYLTCTETSGVFAAGMQVQYTVICSLG